VRLARGLGWLSLALGVAKVAAPAALAKAIGIDPRGRTRTVIRILGAREIATGLAALAKPRSSLPLWGRVLGDAMELSLLGVAMRSRKSTGRLVGAALAVAGITALDVWAARRAGPALPGGPAIAAMTINKSPQEVYAFVRKLEQLPQFIDYLESVTERGTITRWVAKLPLGGTVSWDTRITEDRPGEVLAWQSVEDSPIQVRGRVTFARAPGRNATEVRFELELGISRIEAIEALAKLFVKRQVKASLRRLKQLMETGEVLYSDASQERLPRPAQPAKSDEKGTAR
jgi:hypothetical protein